MTPIEDNASLKEFFEQKIGNYQTIFPKLDSETILKLCMVLLPKDLAIEFQSDIGLDTQMFLNLAEAFDRKRGILNESDSSGSEEADEEADEEGVQESSQFSKAEIENLIQSKFDDLEKRQNASIRQLFVEFLNPTQ